MILIFLQKFRQQSCLFSKTDVAQLNNKIPMSKFGVYTDVSAIFMVTIVSIILSPFLINELRHNKIYSYQLKLFYL